MNVIDVGVDLAVFTFMIGTILLEYRLFRTAKSGSLEQGMKILWISGLFLIIAVLADVFQDIFARSPASAIDIVFYDFALLLTIFTAFIGLRTIVLRKWPPLYFIWGWGLTRVRWLMHRGNWRITEFFSSDISSLNLDKTLWASPAKIVYSSLREFDARNLNSGVLGGDWDRLEKKFDDSDVYVALKQVFTEGKNLPETVFYKRTLDSLAKGGYLWGCANQNDFHSICNDIEELFRAIKDIGHEFIRSEQMLDRLAIYPEIIVSIGRHGDLLFSDGAFKLALAKLLGIAEIPVKVAVRHPGWIRLIKELVLYSRTLDGGELYQPATHPDLKEIAASPIENRFSMIKHHMSAKQGLLLDIGANLGYFSHRFEEEGFDCYAVENSPETLHFLRMLWRAENRKFKIVSTSVYEWPQVGEMHFDVVLALNVFHHALKFEQSYFQLVGLLKNLPMRELFLESAAEDEPQMKGAYMNYSPSEFVNFIERNSCLKRVETIGQTEYGRTMYRFF